MDLYREVIKHIKFEPKPYTFHVAGSIYRGSTDPGDIDIIMVVPKISNVLTSIKFKSNIPYKLKRVGERMISFEIMLPGDKYYTPVQIWASTKKEFPFMLLAWAGGKYNIRLRKVAEHRGYLLNQYGLFNRITGEPINNNIDFKTIADIQKFLNVTVRPLQSSDV